MLQFRCHDRQGLVTFYGCAPLLLIEDDEREEVTHILVCVVDGDVECWGLDNDFGRDEVDRYYAHFGITAERLLLGSARAWYALAPFAPFQEA